MLVITRIVCCVGVNCVNNFYDLVFLEWLHKTYEIDDIVERKLLEMLSRDSESDEESPEKSNFMNKHDFKKTFLCIVFHECKIDDMNFTSNFFILFDCSILEVEMDKTKYDKGKEELEMKKEVGSGRRDESITQEVKGIDRSNSQDASSSSSDETSSATSDDETKSMSGRNKFHQSTLFRNISIYLIGKAFVF